MLLVAPPRVADSPKEPLTISAREVWSRHALRIAIAVFVLVAGWCVWDFTVNVAPNGMPLYLPQTTPCPCGARMDFTVDDDNRPMYSCMKCGRSRMVLTK